jgi:hypothetical protein
MSDTSFVVLIIVERNEKNDDSFGHHLIIFEMESMLKAETIHRIILFIYIKGFTGEEELKSGEMSKSPDVQCEMWKQ